MTTLRIEGRSHFHCDRLQAEISAKQCLLNQGRASAFKESARWAFGRLRVCIDCPVGKKMEANPPVREGEC